MNITATAVAVTLAVVIAVAFLFFGPNVFRPFTTGNLGATDTSQTQTMATSTDSSGAINLSGGSDANANSSASAAASRPQVPAQLPTTLTVTDEVVGTGAAVKTGDTIVVKYVGSLPNGTVFDASDRHAETKNGFAFTIGVDPVIKGWQQGLLGMQVGGKRQLIIPPDLAYGAQGAGSTIPPNATLIFEVQLLSIGK